MAQFLRRTRNLFCVLAALVITGGSLAGCALFKKDLAFDNGQIVARVNGVEITKRQLINEYNRYGYQYTQNEKLSVSAALDRTLDDIIDNEIMAALARQYFGELTEEESGRARKSAFDAVEASFKEIEKEVREKYNSADSAGGDSAESTPAKGVTYTPYEKYLVKSPDSYKNIYDENGNFVRREKMEFGEQYKLNLEKYRNPKNSDRVPTNDEFLNTLFKPRGDSKLEESISNEIFNRMVRYISNSEDGVGGVWENGKWVFKKVKYDTDAEKRASILREIIRIEREEEVAILGGRFGEVFELGLDSRGERTANGEKFVVERLTTTNQGLVVTHEEVDNLYSYLNEIKRTNFDQFAGIVEQKNQTAVTQLANRARAEFREQLKLALFRYNYGYEDRGGYGAKMLESLENLYFVPKNTASQFFTVSHLLLQYSEDQKKEKEQLDADLKSGKITKDARDRGLEILKANVTAQKSVDGIPTGPAMTAEEILNYVKSYVAPFSPTKPLEQKQKDFRDMIYAFNQDPGMQNPKFEYVIGADLREDKSENSTEADSNSKMVKEFTEASRKLFNFNADENRGGVMRAADYKQMFNLSDSYLGNRAPDDLIDTRGTMSDLVWTDYGAHIIMFTRNISDFIFTNTEDMIDQNLDAFLNATQTSYGNKTYFDAAVESITKPSFENRKNQLLNDWKAVNEVTYYKSRYKNLTKTK